MKKSLLFALFLCLFISALYSLLSIVNFNHYGAFGFDLGVIDQMVWKFSLLKAPINTIHFYPFQSLLFDHLELIYIPISFFYWIYSSPVTLIIIEPLVFCLSGLAIFLLAKEKGLNLYLSFILLFSYLIFYGVQNALWFNIHGVSFGASFIAWFLYFKETKKFNFSLIFFLLAIFSRENIAFLTFLISLYYFLVKRKKEDLIFMSLSIIYLVFVFFVYFPYLTPDGYRYKNSDGLISNIFNISSFVNSYEKREVLFDSLLWVGFVPLINPLTLIPFLGDLFSYFVIASNLKGAHGLFMHYRITLAPLLFWSTILTIARFNFLKKWYICLLLIICPLILQYQLHLPLSYLSKSWLWEEPKATKNINKIISFIPKNAAVVSQNNITPHISQRDKIFTLWPEKKSFLEESPCNKKECDWFRWAGNPEYLVVDISKNWDIRHLLINREDFMKGLNNMEALGKIKKFKQIESAFLYKIMY